MAKKKKKKMKKLPMIILLVLILGVGGVIAFNVFAPKDLKEKVKETTEKVAKKKKPEEKVDVIDVNGNVRNVAVMINNHPKARPLQSGLNDAHIIYEILAEGGITRYLAVFNDKDTERIGSVRSSRHYFLDYALENDAVYVHWGWSPQAQKDIRSLGIKNINGLTYEGVYFYRDKSLNVPLEHTGFTDMERINKAIKKLKYNDKTEKEPLLTYNVKDEDLSTREDAIIANNVSIPYSNMTKTSYVYDAETKTYKRFVNDKEHTDYVTKEQYGFKNIITYKLGTSVIDSYGRLDLKNIGSGEGYYITNGYAIPIKWEKSTRKSQTRYYYTDGTELKVSDGNTFIQIQPTSRTLTISE